MFRITKKYRVTPQMGECEESDVNYLFELVKIWATPGDEIRVFDSTGAIVLTAAFPVANEVCPSCGNAFNVNGYKGFCSPVCYERETN